MLRRLNNDKNKLGNMIILISPTAIFTNGTATIIVKMGGKRGIATPKYIYRTDSLTNSSLGKYFFDKFPINFFVTREIRMKERRTKVHLSPTMFQTSEKNNERMAKAKNQNMSLKASLELMKKAIREEKKKKSFLNISCIRKRSDLKKFTLAFRPNFNDIMAMSKSNKFMREVTLAQRGILDINAAITIHEGRFTYSK